MMSAQMRLLEFPCSVAQHRGEALMIDAPRTPETKYQVRVHSGLIESEVLILQSSENFDLTYIFMFGQSFDHT